MKREFYLRIAIVLGLVAAIYGGYYVQQHPYRVPVEESARPAVEASASDALTNAH